MTPRFRPGTLLSLVAVGMYCALVSDLVWSEFRDGGIEAAWALIVFVPYAIFSIAWVARFETFSASLRTALLTACLAVCTLLPRAMTGRLGAVSLPMIVFGPSLPFVVAWRIGRLTEPDVAACTVDPSPTLSALLRGKRLRAAAAGPHRVLPRKPLPIPGPFDEPLL